MLNQVRVRGFKALYDTKFVKLQPLTLLIGRNGAGKSSLLEAIQWLQEAMARGLSWATNERFDSISELINRRTTTGIELDLLFDEGKEEVRYFLAVKERTGAIPRPIVAEETCRENRRRRAVWTIKSRKGGGGPAVRSLRQLDMNPIRDGDALAIGSAWSRAGKTGVERAQAFVRDAVFLRLSPTALAKKESLTPSPKGPRVQDDGSGTVALLNSLSAEQRQWVAGRLSGVIEGAERVRLDAKDKEQAFFVLGERMTVRGGQRVEDIPSWLVSEGTRRLVTLFCLLAVQPRPSLIAIEEIENGLDPWTLQLVFQELRIAADEGIQIIVTTHSPFLLDHVDLEQVLRVQRQAGDTILKPATDFEAVAKYRGVIAPGAMYLSGFFDDKQD